MASYKEDEIPIISLAGIDGGDRATVKEKIAKACETWGIFQAVDHGVDPKLISDMIRLSKDFFKLPLEDKLQFDMSVGEKGGYNYMSTERKREVKDWREVLTFFTYPRSDRKYSKWPEKPEGLREKMGEFSEKLMELNCKLMQLLSEAMDLDKEALENACGELTQKVLANFYPKLTDVSDLDHLGLRRHTDLGIITILLQDQVEGLQATKDGGNSWITLPPKDGAFVVNIGDYGHFVSNGRFKSADHRALANSKSNRLSIATFQYPAADAIAYPLKLREGENPIIDNPITFQHMYNKKMSKEPVLAIYNENNNNT